MKKVTQNLIKNLAKRILIGNSKPISVIGGRYE